MDTIQINHLRELEAESIFVIREVAAQFENPVMLFSGGKDSIVMFHLAMKAFWPAKIPFPMMHIDTGHNFQETLDYRDKLMSETGTKLIVASVQESIDQGRVTEEKGINEEYLVPKMDEWEVFVREAVAVGMKAQEEGVARLKVSREELEKKAEGMIRRGREEIEVLMKHVMEKPSWGGK